MRLAVLTNQFVEDAPEGIPAEWPAEVREISDDDELPSDDWVSMTHEEYLEHLAAHREAYDEWAAANAVAPLTARYKCSDCEGIFNDQQASSRHLSETDHAYVFSVMTP